jgi:predicted site-specific integrase-resolvase
MEMDSLLLEYSANYPPLITLKQAAQIAQVPMGTIYDWSHSGHFDEFGAKRGRWVRLSLAGFVRFLMTTEGKKL